MPYKFKWIMLAMSNLCEDSLMGLAKQTLKYVIIGVPAVDNAHTITGKYTTITF